jgi:hypothetical protein
MQEHML